MSEEFDKSMKEKYPHLFEGIHPQQPIALFGFEIGKGWHKLIDDTLGKLSQECRLFQVKEKFGGLRVYYEKGNESDLKVVEEAEEKASITCEVCGAPGKMRCHGGWLHVACDEHAQ